MKRALLLSTACLLIMGQANAAPAGSSSPAASQSVALPNGTTPTISSVLTLLQSDVTKRTPTQTDDSSVGFGVGDMWLAPGNIVYQARQVLPGQAIWTQYLPAKVRPLDLLSGATVGYADRALKAAWLNGNFIDVSATAGGTATTIKFINGEPDIASLDALLGGACGYVSKWYDQSGNANDATQTTAANQPVICPQNLVAGLRSIVFNSVQGGSSTVAKYLNIPTTASFQPNITSAAIVAQSRSTVMSGSFVMVGSTPSAGSNFLAAASSNNAPGMSVNGIIGSAPIPMPVNPVVSIFSVSTTASLYADNAHALGVSTGRPNTPVTGGLIGYNVVGAGGPAEYDGVAVIVKNAQFSTIDIDNLRASLSALFNITPQIGRDNVVVWDGDSITNGYGATYMQNHPRQALAQLPFPARAYNTGVHGILLQGAQSLTSRFAATFPVIYSPTARNFVVSEGVATNDLSAGTDPATLYAAYVAYGQSIKALGLNVRLVVRTVTPTTNAYNAQVTTFNAMLRAGWKTFADGLSDVAFDPTISVSANNPQFSPDGLHWTDYGYSYIAQIDAAAIAKVMQ